MAAGGASALIGPRPPLARPGCWDDAVAAARAARFRRIGFFERQPEPERRDG
ncbi:hypothetical protein [Sphingosinicella sp.]|uniref:hypothetical protein n=1 Tax=Sphingosinicella sp. TaxID=1917971 RepID=UPI0040379151